MKIFTVIFWNWWAMGHNLILHGEYHTDLKLNDLQQKRERKGKWVTVTGNEEE